MSRDEFIKEVKNAMRNNKNSWYNKLLEVDGKTIRTDDGHEWFVNSGIRQGTRVSLDFDTRNTEMLEDDIIVSIKPITINNGLKKSVIVDYKYVK